MFGGFKRLFQFSLAILVCVISLGITANVSHACSYKFYEEDSKYKFIDYRNSEPIPVLAYIGSVQDVKISKNFDSEDSKIPNYSYSDLIPDELVTYVIDVDQDVMDNLPEQFEFKYIHDALEYSEQTNDGSPSGWVSNNEKLKGLPGSNHIDESYDFIGHSDLKVGDQVAYISYSTNNKFEIQRIDHAFCPPYKSEYDSSDIEFVQAFADDYPSNINALNRQNRIIRMENHVFEYTNFYLLGSVFILGAAALISRKVRKRKPLKTSDIPIFLLKLIGI